MDRIKEYLVQSLQEILGIDEETIPENDNLLAYGLNSIKLMKLVGWLKQKNIPVSFLEMITEPTLCAWTSLCEKKADTGRPFVRMVHDEKAVGERFEMTPMQKAYFWGRGTDQPLGGVSCHAYVEYQPQIQMDIEKLRTAWNQLLKKHPALRTRFFTDGTQQIMEEPQAEHFFVYDLSRGTQTEKKERFHSIRSQLSHEILDVEHGEVIKLVVLKMDEAQIRVHISLDLLVADVVSFRIILDDLIDFYLGNAVETSLNWSFRDYIETVRELHQERYAEDQVYWENKIASMQPGSSLLLANRPETISGAFYQRYQFALSKEEYGKLKEFASKQELTIAMILLTFYSWVLARWSGRDDFVINVPLFNRDLLIPVFGTENAVADFTSLILLDIHVDRSLSLCEQAKRIQKTFYENYHHASVDGIEVQRMLSRRSNDTITAPIVFSCTEGMEQFSEKSTKLFGIPDFIITQTPQVYIDFQVFQVNDVLFCSWDVPNELFHEEMISEMFAVMKQGILQLIHSPEEQSAVSIDNVVNPVHSVRQTMDPGVLARPIFDSPEVKNSQLLHSGFYENVKIRPDQIALIDAESGVKYTYRQLAQAVSFLSGKLMEQGVQNGDRVVVTVDRGPKEIISLLAILSIGACYVPITPNQPMERRQSAIDTMKIRYLLHDLENTKSVDVSEKSVQRILFETGTREPPVPPLPISENQAAYIILTSGTTGVPKGVTIAHASAMNTVSDINCRLSLTERDTLLAVSSIEFDLSVYDIFGTFSAGGTLVVLGKQHSRDAEFWRDTIETYHVSVWNSVPLLFDMLLTASEMKDDNLPLRAVLLSGDWISSSLYERLRKQSGDCRLIGMGGATEASIWSNWYEVHSEKDLRGDYIPYGWALDNQAYRIVDTELRDCPRWCVGELLIGGMGLALEYAGDPEKTNEKFIMDQGQRWYRTGDLGYFQSDDCIIFLGRMDQQCKVRGHRIEVEEIEKYLRGFFGVEYAVCWPAGSSTNYNHLEACVFRYQKPLDEAVMKEARNYLKQYLPYYMIPTVIYAENMVPLTANGKIDRKTAANIAMHHAEGTVPENGRSHSDAHGEQDKKLAALWCENLGMKEVSPKENYYFAGGDSLKAIRLCARINETFGIKLSTSEILEAQTFEVMLELINRQML